MKRLRSLLEQPEFQVLLFCGGFMLFNWPLLGLFDLQSLEDVFVYLFMAWAAVIAVLFFIGNSRPDSNSRQ